jgi:hypothetical protein
MNKIRNFSVSTPCANDVNVSNLLRRIRFAIKKLQSSPAQMRAYKLQCEAANTDYLTMISDVTIHWNSTFYMLQRLLRQRTGFNNWFGTEKLNSLNCLIPSKLSNI